MKKFLLLSISFFLFVNFSHSQITRGLICHYKLDGNAQDESVYQNHGVVMGNATPCPDRFNNPYGAICFDGQTGYISVPHGDLFNNIQNEFTISAWAKIDVSSDNWWITICCKGNQALESANSPHFRFQLTKLTASWVTGNVANWQQNYDLDQWYFWVITFNGQTINIYQDGTNIASFTYTQGLFPNTDPLEIGRDVPGNTEYFKGSIDDLRIYDRCLSYNEVQTLFHDEPTVSEECVYPTTIDDHTVRYSIREYKSDIHKIRIFAKGKNNDVIYVNFNGTWEQTPETVSPNRRCIFEKNASAKCNYILFKSDKGFAVFDIDLEGEIYNIECDENTYYGIKIIYE